MIITYEEIKPYLHQLDFNNSNTLCSSTMFFSRNACEKCIFDKNYSCMLNFTNNYHLPQLVKLLKEKHPELFI